MIKFCRYCGTEKDIDDFSKHPQTKDGYSGKCKECTSAFTRKWYRDTILTRISYEKEREQSPDRKTAKFKYQKEGREKNTLVYKAHNAVGNAIRDGFLHRQPCQNCGTKKTEAHHPDYTKPLEVEWLCRSCHLSVHGKITFNERLKNEDITHGGLACP